MFCLHISQCIHQTINIITVRSRPMTRGRSCSRRPISASSLSLFSYIMQAKEDYVDLLDINLKLDIDLKITCLHSSTSLEMSPIAFRIYEISRFLKFVIIVEASRSLVSWIVILTKSAASMLPFIQMEY